MSSRPSIVGGIQSLRVAKDYFEDFQRDEPNSKGAKLFSHYIKKIDWVFNDIITNPAFDEDVRQGIKKELNSDLFVVPAIQEKVSLLDPDKREFIETLIDAMLKGEEIKILA